MDFLASISSPSIGSSWLILGFIVLALLIIVLTLEKVKAAMILLLLYVLGFAALQTPRILKVLNDNMEDKELTYFRIALGILPVLALLALKFKRKRR